MARRNARCNFRRNAPHENARLRLDDRDAAAALGGTCGKFQPDKSAADDGNAFSADEFRSYFYGIGEIAQQQGALCARLRKPPGLRPRCNQQAVVGNFFAVGERHGFCIPVYCRGRTAPQKIDLKRGHHALIKQIGGLRLGLLHDGGLGKRRPVIGSECLIADERNRALPGILAECDGGARPRLAAAHNHHAGFSHAMRLYRSGLFQLRL